MDNIAEATQHDMPRPAATSGETDYTLPLEEVSDRYAKAGHPRTLRSLQRYCGNGHLDAQKIATATGDKFLVTPLSVARHIAQIEELTGLEAVATGRNLPRQVATTVTPEERASEDKPPSTVGHDMPRQGPTGAYNAVHETAATPDVSRYVTRLEREVEQAIDERDFLREQIDRKDRTIDSLLERDRETNFLIRGLQELIPRLGAWVAVNPRSRDNRMHSRNNTTRSSASPLLITRRIGRLPRYNAWMEHIGANLENAKRNIEIIGADPVTRHGFTQVPNFILTNKGLSVGGKLAYAMLLKYAWTDDACFPGQQKLAEDIGSGERSVRTYLKELEDANFLEVTRRGLGKTNLYRLHVTVKKRA